MDADRAYTRICGAHSERALPDTLCLTWTSTETQLLLAGF